MAQFMLLLRGGDASANYTPEEAQQMIQRYVDWSRSLGAAGKLRSAEELGSSARTLRASNGSVAVDGPFTETKEAIGGFYIIEAADLDEATDIAKDCPVLRHGGFIDLRPIIEH